MASSADRYRVDLDELDHVIADLEHLESELASATHDLSRQMGRLQETWDGLSAVAQREAHEEWERGMAGMREALAQLRGAARAAHTNYGLAAQANARMWQALR